MDPSEPRLMFAEWLARYACGGEPMAFPGWPDPIALRDRGARFAASPDPIFRSLHALKSAELAVAKAPAALGSAVEAVLTEVESASAARRKHALASVSIALTRLAMRFDDAAVTRVGMRGMLAQTRATATDVDVATGLMAEYALACGRYREAIIYASESLSRGAQKQRMHGVLGQACEQCGQFERARLHYECAYAAQSSQPGLSVQAVHGLSLLIRLDAHRAYLKRDAALWRAALTRWQDAEAAREGRHPVPACLARAALCHAAARVGDLSPEWDFGPLLVFGRYRDLNRWAQMPGAPGEKAAELLSQGDTPRLPAGLAERLDAIFPEAWQVDAEALERLSGSDAPPVDSEGWPTALALV